MQIHHLEKFFYFSGGDASIFPKIQENDQIDQPSASKRPKLDDVEDIYRTGAKCTSEGPQDPRLPGVNYHELGAFRTKPGRGMILKNFSIFALLTHFAIACLILPQFAKIFPSLPHFLRFA